MIKPNDIHVRMPHNEARDALEKKIDAAIKYAALASHWPATLRLRGEPPAVVEEVIGRYRREGWNIERVPDPRDGDFIRIEAP